MICGIDVYHSGIGAGARKSVAGFVASLDPQMTKWHSRICMQASNQELVDMLQVCLTSAINAYYEVMNALCIFQMLDLIDSSK
jgi:aubergine